VAGILVPLCSIQLSMKHRSLKLIFLVFLSSLSGYSQVPANYQMVWNDEFNGTELDAGKWAPCPAWNRQGGSYWEADNLSLNGAGKLTLKVTERNDSVFCGAIRTHNKFDQKYGYFEVRCKVPQIQGGWAAFWLMPYGNKAGSQGNDGTEIDVFESINGWNNKVNHAIHWDGYGADHQKASQSSDRPDIYDNAYHKFAMLWTPTEYIFYIDDLETWRTSAGGVSDVNEYLKLTLEVSGDTWPGDWNNQTEKPINWMIDYVRVYEEAEVTQTFTCDVKNWSHGTATKSPDSTIYTVGTSVELIPQADSGFEFSKWYGTVESSSSTLNLNMDKNYEQIPEFLRTGEMITNSQFFDGDTNWLGSGATMTVDTGSYFTTVTAITTNPWDIQLLQGGLQFESGYSYNVTVVASASEGRTIVVSLGMSNSPWTSFGSKTLSLTSSPQTFTLSVSMSASEAAGRVALNLGKYTGDVLLQEISVVKQLITSTDTDITGNEIRIWPNPTTDKLYWNGVGAGGQLKIIDVTGRLLQLVDQNEGQVDISHLPEGIYTVLVDNQSFKVIKK
jgi:beta-glucanase (GH16 family)